MKDESLPLISIVIPLYYSSSVLEQVLDALYNLDYPKKKIELIFSYYPSKDNTLKIVKRFKQNHLKEYYNILIIICEKRGVSYGRNVGIMKSNGEYVLLLDDDIKLHKDTLRDAVNKINQTPKTAAVIYDYLSVKPNLLERARHLAFEKSSDVWITGCSLIKKKIVEEVGLYDENLGYPYSIHEDLDLTVRLRKKGFTLVKGSLLQIHLSKGNIRLENSKKPMLFKYIKGYFTSYADSYHIVLLRGTIKMKVTLIINLLLVPFFIMFFLLFPYLSIATFLIIYSTIIVCWKLDLNDFYLPLIIFIGRVIRSYGYLFRRLYLTILRFFRCRLQLLAVNL